MECGWCPSHGPTQAGCDLPGRYCKFRHQPVSWIASAWTIQRDFRCDLSGPRRHDGDARRQVSALVDRMRDEKHREMVFVPQFQQIVVQSLAGKFVESREWFVHQ